MSFTVKDNLFESGDCSFEILKVGTEHCSPRKQPVDCVRPSYALHFVLFGRGMLVVGDKKYVLNSGEAFLLFKGEKYSYVPDAKNPWSYTWVEVQGELDELFSLCGFTKESCCKKLVTYDGYIELMKELQKSFDASPTQSIRCSAYFMLLCSRFIENRLSGKDIKDTSKKRIMRDILIYVNNNCLSEALSLQTIATENGISVATLLRLFDEFIGMSPVEYMNAYKVSIACEKMQDGGLNVSEAAFWSGFDDEKYFARVFKRVKGMTPMEYRKNNSDEDPFLWLKEKKMLFR